MTAPTTTAPGVWGPKSLKLSDAQRTALKWLFIAGPTIWLPVTISKQTRNRLEERGLIRRASPPKGSMMTAWEVTEPGRQALGLPAAEATRP